MTNAEEPRPEFRKYGRTVVQKFWCPRCGAGPGAQCIGRKGPRKSTHIERVRKTVEILGEPRGQGTSEPE